MFGKNDNKEEIYHKKNKYVIVIKDLEVGERLYEVVKSLKSKSISTLHSSFKFTKYGLTGKNTVKWICVEGYSNLYWDCLSNMEKVIEVQRFVEEMQDNGFVLDDHQFNNLGCESIAEFLSFFIQSDEDEEIERSKGCMIQYIHYVCSNGGNLKDFYDNFSEEVALEGYEIPYSPLVTKMCYEYYKT